MAKLDDLNQLKGVIGDLVFYQLNGVTVVRRKSGFNKEAFQNNPNYAKVKQNSSEFGHASKSGKMIRDALSDCLSKCGDKLMYQKFAKVMTQIKDLDTKSERGSRKVEIGMQNESAMKLLKEFQFGEIKPASEVISTMQGFFTDSLILGKTGFDHLTVITLQPYFQNYTIDKNTQEIPLKAKQNSAEFDRNFPESSLLLHFAVLSKKEEILYMGFV